MRAWRKSKGQKSRAIHWPATSSMTTNCGSLRPDCAGDDGGGGDAEDEREGDAGEQDEEQRVRSGMEEPGVGGPEENGGDRAPGAGAGLADSRRRRRWRWHRRTTSWRFGFGRV